MRYQVNMRRLFGCLTLLSALVTTKLPETMSATLSRAGALGKKMAVCLALGIEFAVNLYAGDIPGHMFIHDGDFTFYTLDDGTAELCKYTGTAARVSIPATVRYVRTYKDEDGTEHTRTYYLPVVRIGGTYSGSGKAFKGNTTLQSVSLPSSVRAIGYEAFANCTSLSQFPFANITNIYRSAFSNTGLTSVNIPNLENLGEYAFYSCKQLTEVTLGGTAMVGNSQTFVGCSALKKITIGGRCSLSDHGSYSRTYETSPFGGCSSLEEICLGEGVTVIPQNCFHRLPALRKVQATPSLVKIEGGFYGDCGAFVGCTNLVSFNAFPYLKEIGRYSFSGCSALAGEVNLQKLEAIGDEAFASCSNIVSVTTGTNVMSYAGRVFRDCASLRTAELYGNGNCTLMGGLYDNGYNKGFFDGCTSLETCRIGDGISAIVSHNYVGRITTSIFNGCDSLREVYFGKSITNLASVTLQNHGALETCHFPGVADIPGGMFGNCTNLATISSLTNVQTIGNQAFSQCRSLCGDIDLSSIRTIGDGAFLGCTGIVSVVFGENLDRLSSKDMCYYYGEAFKDCANAETFVFMGPPSSNACYRAFTMVKDGAHGYYLEKYRDKWEPVIDVNGMWKGLIMGPVMRPKLEITEVEWDRGSATLDWSSTEDNLPVKWPCSLYRGTTPDFGSATKIVESTRATSYVDIDFLGTRPKTKPLYYWVVPDGVGADYDPGVGLATRRRFGRFVGFSTYDEDPDTGKSWQEVYASMLLTTKQVRDMFGGFGFKDAFLLEDPETQEVLSGTIADDATRVAKGDIYVLWIFTHGGTKKVECEGRVTFLAMKQNRERYFASQLANDLSAFDKYAVVVPIIYACHSGGMLDLSDASPTLDMTSCFSYKGGVAACSATVVSPAVNGTAEEFDSFGRFFLDSKDYKHQNRIEEDNGDGDLTLHEMVEYVKQQQNWFTPYAVAQERGTLNNVLVMQENDQRATGSPPETPQGLTCTPNADGSKVTFSWDGVSGAEWYSIQGIFTDGNEGYLPKSHTSRSYDTINFARGRTYTVTVCAGNKYGRSGDASTDYKEDNYRVTLKATNNRADGIKLTWTNNVAETDWWDDNVGFKGYTLSRRGMGTSDYGKIAKLAPSDHEYLDKDVGIGAYEYRITMDDLFGYNIASCGNVAGKRVKDYSLDISINPSSVVPLPADFEGKTRRYFSIKVTATAAWTYSIPSGSFCGVVTADGKNYGNGRIYLYCQANETSVTRRTVVTISMQKADGGTISKQCIIEQCGKGESSPYQSPLSQYMRQLQVSSAEELLAARDSYGVPLLMSYAFQGNIADGEAPALTISMDADGKPCVSMPMQNPSTALDVDVRLEASTDLRTWNTVFEDVDPVPSQDGRREIHFPSKNGSTEFFRFKVDLR